MTKYKVKVGIIGGSGLGDIITNILKNRSEIPIEQAKNDFGLPSSPIYLGSISDVDVALLSRHGSGHCISPTNVNYRANIEALKNLGCTHILASTICGSLRESIGRGQLVVPDSFIDRTRSRSGTLFDGTSSKYFGVCHIPMEPAFHPNMSNMLIRAGNELNLNVKKGGTIVTIEGPRFSSKAESKALQMWGGDLVNMTTCPEVCVAKEAGLLYATIAMATDYDCWRDSEESVCAAEAIAVLKKNVDKITNIIVKSVELIGTQNWDEDINELENLIKSSNMTVKKS